MKVTKTKTEITIETRHLVTLPSRGHRTACSRPIWCNICSATVGMYLPEHAAVVGQTTTREIYRRVESGDLHFVETREGELLICGNSLPHN
jgi:hypothetical protein